MFKGVQMPFSVSAMHIPRRSSHRKYPRILLLARSLCRRYKTSDVLLSNCLPHETTGELRLESPSLHTFQFANETGTSMQTPPPPNSSASYLIWFVVIYLLSYLARVGVEMTRTETLASYRRGAL